MEHKNVFISYSSKDEETAFSICELLEADGISCWIAPRNVTGGQSYGREILEAIFDADVTLFIFSGNSNHSRHVENEIDNAFNAGKIIIPFKIEEQPLSLELQYYLNKTHWINGYPVPKEAIENLKKAIKANLPQKTIDCKEGYIETEQEGRYDILQNSSGEILIIIDYHKDAPYMPRLVYDGGANALLYRNRSSAILLDAINTKARQSLAQVEEILIVEIQNDDAAREYKVPVRHIKSLDALIK